MFGVSRVITINGIYQGTIAQQKTFITAIESFNNGAQVSSTFISSVVTSPANYKVFVQTFKWDKSAADIGKINYTLTLLEGANVS